MDLLYSTLKNKNYPSTFDLFFIQGKNINSITKLIPPVLKHTFSQQTFFGSVMHWLSVLDETNRKQKIP